MIHIPLDDFERELVTTYNAYVSCTVSCINNAGIFGMSFFDVFVLQLLSQQKGPKRLVDICYILKVEEQYTVNYSLKKLIRLNLVLKERRAKFACYSVTRKGQEVYSKYLSIRHHFQHSLIERVQERGDSCSGFEEGYKVLQLLRNTYEQTARSIDSQLTGNDKS